LHGRILANHVFLYCVKISLHKSRLIESIHSGTLITVSHWQWIFQTCGSTATNLLMLLFT